MKSIMFNGKGKKGIDLCKKDQNHVLNAYCNRLTGEHIPNWIKETKYKIHFKNDQEWLENTFFAVKENGELDNRYKICDSFPTWPEGKH